MEGSILISCWLGFREYLLRIGPLIVSEQIFIFFPSLCFFCGWWVPDTITMPGLIFPREFADVHGLLRYGHITLTLPSFRFPCKFADVYSLLWRVYITHTLPGFRFLREFADMHGFLRYGPITLTLPGFLFPHEFTGLYGLLWCVSCTLALLSFSFFRFLADLHDLLRIILITLALIGLSNLRLSSNILSFCLRCIPLLSLRTWFLFSSDPIAICELLTMTKCRLRGSRYWPFRYRNTTLMMVFIGLVYQISLEVPVVASSRLNRQDCVPTRRGTISFYCFSF